MSETRIERKLAAILYADVAGYSRLTGLDEEGTHRRLSTYLDVISDAVRSGGGRVVHYAGDAVLADFGSVVDAVGCAIAVQRDLKARNRDLPADRRVEFRIGINLGDVMVDRNDIYGDGVNVAARLETLAEVGGICVSDLVYEQVRSHVDVGFLPLGRQRVKNIAEPVRAYHVVLDKGAGGWWSGLRRRLGLARPVIRGRFAKILVAAALMVVALVGIQFAFTGGPVAPGKGPVPVVVLPFRVIGDAPKAKDFGEGLTADLVTDLSKQADLRIMVPPPGQDTLGGDSAFVDARYRIEGTIRVADGRLRINVQLVGLEAGYNLWGARFDRGFTNTLTVQADVAKQVVAGLTERLSELQVAQARAQATVGGILMSGLEYLGRFGEAALAAPLNIYENLSGKGSGG